MLVTQQQKKDGTAITLNPATATITTERPASTVAAFCSGREKDSSSNSSSSGDGTVRRTAEASTTKARKHEKIATQACNASPSALY
jgi:hypothetical protein